MEKITIIYRSVDGYRTRRSYKSLAGARKFAHDMIGEHPEIGSNYAVSGDGIGKVMVSGATLADIFPPHA